VLPDEAAVREALRVQLSDSLLAWGYSRVETPIVERLDMLESGAGPLADAVFKLTDSDGTLLALRPDLTVPIARLVASRFAERPGPHRLFYVADVFRERESLRGQARQFTQAGVELIGASGAAADAECVAVLADSLKTAGLKQFLVSVGSVEVLSAIIAAAGMPASWGDRVMVAAHQRNLVELRGLSSAKGVSPQAQKALQEVPRLSGGVEAIAACRETVAGFGCDAALDALEEMLGLLAAAGAAKDVVVDFSVMRSFDYYTGIVIEACAPGIGVPLGGGGRYDGVLGRLGAPLTAAGFALGIERLAIALAEQTGGPCLRGLDAVVGGDAASALASAAMLRRIGWRVRVSERAGARLLDEAEREGARMAMVAAPGSLARLDRDGRAVGLTSEELSVPPTLAQPGVAQPDLGGGE